MFTSKHKCLCFLCFLFLLFIFIFPFAPKVLAEQTFVNITSDLTLNQSPGSVCGWYSGTFNAKKVFGIAIYRGNFPDTTNFAKQRKMHALNSYLSDCSDDPYSLEYNFIYSAIPTPDGTYWVRMTANGYPYLPDYHSVSYYFEARRLNGVWSLLEPSSCTDGIQNQDETGVDIGGVCTVPSSEDDSTQEDLQVETPTPLEEPACTENCNSNVLFFPGIMGSKLYERGVVCDSDINIGECVEQKLWFSTNDSLQADLSLDTNGKSVGSIYTKNDTQKLSEGEDETGVIDKIDVINLYKSFFADLKNLKDEGEIVDYAFVPYDWRLSLNDIVTNGKALSENRLSYVTSQDFSESFILQKLEELQASSRTGKVTIIAHSNGGLVTKALIQKLKDTNNPLYEKIDKIIFVAVPQVGTPDAMAALLHGSDLGPFGLIMSASRHRQLAENMSTVYHLLPSAAYFTTVDPGFAIDKLVSFEDQTFFTPQTSQYGVFVSNATELKNYILGTDGRAKPSSGEIVLPNIGNADLYAEAESVHAILDSWMPFSETKVIQVAGWGEETLAGLDYMTLKDSTEHLSYKPRMVIDGDASVLVPSALWMSDSSPNIERWWVNLEEDEPFSVNREHRDILEISNLRKFIEFRITQDEDDNSLFTDEDNIIVNNDSTLISDKPRLHFTLHSPLTLSIVDSQDRYTGLDPDTMEIREEIPGATYKKIGEVQFISVPAGVSYTLLLDGYENGFFTLDIDEQTGNEITDSISFEGISSSNLTLVTMDISSSFGTENSELRIDEDGNGSIDKVYNVVNGVTQYIDQTPIITPIISSSGSQSRNRTSNITVQETVPVEEKIEVEEEINVDFVPVIEDPGESDDVVIDVEKESKKEIQPQETSETEILEEAPVPEDLPLSASAADSGFANNFSPYAMILGVVGLAYLSKMFFIKV
ncbi:hypothetical protein A2917_03440 [Candidatus Nomurabacteria bacterium RIFCSPLOWO2_01_FULL_42_17]|uniref:Uncharacterized protein n=1 Tax=Candidatus Nomurabacteria bacterium RIFCSPLOWO2_01_FULL_42_17 TaxID=1801780 RepID=A0A1F6XN54_9BACT|nr:MAG: hypothetical protein A2917_03440 [Candidatus Nomurabacteria bacterium RIFCSPLOWO2_01_FULL_42_17]